MKRIAIDCRFAATPHGLGRYVRELIPRLLRRAGGVSYVLLVPPQARAWADALSNASVITVDAPHYSIREQWIMPRLLRETGADVLFSPHFNVPYLCPLPFVATIHDLILHRFPNDASFPRQWAYRFLMRRTVLRARRLIAVSRFTASEVRALYGDGVFSKVTVIHEGIDAMFRRVAPAEYEKVLARHGITQPFFLYVGSAKQHKNVPLLLQAFAAVSLAHISLVLVTGGKEAASLPVSRDVTVISNVSDADLPALYSAARAFVTASLYEGFGLPIAEAAACGCPVIAVDATAIPEVAPRGSLLLPPTVDAFAQAFRNPPPSRDPAPVRTWEEVAEETVAVLWEALRD